MISILTWVSIIAGGLLIILLLLSLVSGLDLDTETEVDGGGLGLIKGILTFISIGSWVIKIILATDQHPGIAIGIGLVAGLLAVWLLGTLLKLLISNEENVNWSPEDAIFQDAKVYLKIPINEGSGIIQVKINGVIRELKARTKDKVEIPTGSTVYVTDIIDEIAWVTISKF